MVSVCIYFQAHQPFRLKKDYSFFKIGRDHDYEDEELNRQVCAKVCQKCYLPANRIILENIDRYCGRFKIAFSLSGVLIEQLLNYFPAVIEQFIELAATGCVEFLSETYYHSLAFLYSRNEFQKQVLKHRSLIGELFKQRPETFRNTELIYSDDFARLIEELGYRTVLAEGSHRLLGGRSPNFLYRPADCSRLNLMTKNYRFSDDIAFRFSDRGWDQYPLTADKYASWIHTVSGSGELVNLFMDYETFGEHQWEETGIFDFLRELPGEVLKKADFHFITPAESRKYHSPSDIVSCKSFTSWADTERDLTAWTGNALQVSALEMVYALEKRILSAGSEDLEETWRRLLTSDHFYYMCTKWFSDGDVHRYFNPYSSPYDAYITYVNILNDISLALDYTEAADLASDLIACYDPGDDRDKDPP